MSIPPDPPDPPDQPGKASHERYLADMDAARRAKKEKRQGAVAAVVVVLVSSVFGNLVGSVFGALAVLPVVGFGCLLLGSILTVVQPHRRFGIGIIQVAAGVLILSALGVLAVAGICASTSSTS